MLKSFFAMEWFRFWCLMGYLCRLNRLNERKGEGHFKGILCYGGLLLLLFFMSGLQCSEVMRRMCLINVLCRNFKLTIYSFARSSLDVNFFLFLRLRDKRLQESEALENMGKIQDSWCKKSQAKQSQAKPHLSCIFSLVTDLYREGYPVYCGSFWGRRWTGVFVDKWAVDAVLTEDSDLLAYGCKKVPFS